MRWADAAQLPLCLLTPEMHNRSLVDQAFAQAGAAVVPVMETNSVLTLALSVLAGDVCSVLPGALVGAVRSQGELEALPLVAPEMVHAGGVYLSGQGPCLTGAGGGAGAGAGERVAAARGAAQRIAQTLKRRRGLTAFTARQRARLQGAQGCCLSHGHGRKDKKTHFDTRPGENPIQSSHIDDLYLSGRQMLSRPL